MKKVNLKKIFAIIFYGLGVILMFPCFAVFFDKLKIITSYHDKNIVDLSFGSGVYFVFLTISLNFLISDIIGFVRKYIIKKRLEKNVDNYIERKFG